MTYLAKSLVPELPCHPKIGVPSLAVVIGPAIEWACSGLARLPVLEAKQPEASDFVIP